MEELQNMARLVAICREGEEDFPFLARQIPLYIEDTLTVSGALFYLCCLVVHVTPSQPRFMR